jgi:hypothetical protein
MIQPGTAVWFARHESRLAWRDFVAMMTAGKASRRRGVALGIAAFVLGMHVVAWFVVEDVASAVVDKHFLIAVSATILLSWLLMVSQAMESITRAFYTRADLDLILASPVAAERLFAVRIATIALAIAAMALPLAGPFINVLAIRGGPYWLGRRCARPRRHRADPATLSAARQDRGRDRHCCRDLRPAGHRHRHCVALARRRHRLRRRHRRHLRYRDPALVPHAGEAQPIPPPPGLLARGYVRRSLFLHRLGRHRRRCRAQSRARHRAVADRARHRLRRLVPGAAAGRLTRHCEERSDEAIQLPAQADWIASLRSQ